MLLTRATATKGKLPFITSTTRIASDAKNWRRKIAGVMPRKVDRSEVIKVWSPNPGFTTARAMVTDKQTNKETGNAVNMGAVAPQKGGAPPKNRN